MQILDCLLNFGGQIGLWLGFGVMTFLEVIGFGAVICITCCCVKEGHMSLDGETKDLDDIDKYIDKAKRGEDISDDTSDDEDVDPYATNPNEDPRPPPIK